MKIKTDLLTAVTDDQGYIDNFNREAFSGVFNLGLVLGSKYTNSNQYPTNEEGLDTLKYSLDGMIYSCLAGLSGIGGFVGAANLIELSEEDFGNLGIAIKNMAQLGMEAQNHLETIEIDLDHRRKASTTKPEPLAEEV